MLAEQGHSALDMINTSFDFRTDAHGKDPDSYSPTLRQYHQLLWSKPLPMGHDFQLSAKVPGAYLHHRSELGEFILSSDSVIPAFTRWVSLQSIIGQFSEEENEAFRSIRNTIGGMMVFPANRIDGKQTINGARGFNRKIADRFDLTLECIRRHCLGLGSPLSEALSRYHAFFSLFKDLEGYVESFMLQDLVTQVDTQVRFFLPCDNFDAPSVPTSSAAYRAYRTSSIEFVEARNRRIDRYFGSMRSIPLSVSRSSNE